MAFDSLSEKLQSVFKGLRSKGRLTEEDVKAALKEVKLALLEADVNFKVVKQFVKSVQERAVGEEVLKMYGTSMYLSLNEEVTSYIGDSLLKEGTSTASDAIILQKEIQSKLKSYITTSINNNLFIYRFDYKVTCISVTVILNLV